MGRGSRIREGGYQGRTDPGRPTGLMGPQVRAVSSSRRWRVWCSQFASCRWAGYRTADTREQATKRPCPRCGQPVGA